MNNYKNALGIVEGVRVFFDREFDNGNLTSEDLLKIAEYSEEIVIPTLQAKQVFNDDPQAAVGCRFLIPLTKGWTLSALIAYLEDDRSFDVDSVVIHDEIGIPIGDHVKSGWVDEQYKIDLFKIRKD